MNRSFFAILFCALLANAAPAALLPPVDPILPRTDHSFEDHSGHGDCCRDFTSVNMTGASFLQASIGSSNSDGGAIFNDVDSRGASFDDSRLPGSDFRNAKFGGANMNELETRNSDFRGALFHDPIFGYANTIDSADWSGSDFRGVDLSGLFFKVALDRSNFRGTNLRGTRFADFPQLLDDVLFDST